MCLHEGKQCIITVCILAERFEVRLGFVRKVYGIVCTQAWHVAYGSVLPWVMGNRVLQSSVK